MKAALAPQIPCSNPSEHEHMPLLRSLADRAERVAINMALLAELFAWQPPLRPANDACKVQRPPAQRRAKQQGSNEIGRFEIFGAYCARGRAHSGDVAA